MSVAGCTSEIDTLGGGAHLREPERGLRGLTATWEDVQKTRLACEARGQLTVAAQLLKVEHALRYQIKKALAAHVMGDWLTDGVSGVHVARIVALIDDPWRFPGRRCTRGHYMSTAERSSVTASMSGGACPVETWEGRCDGTLLPPRPGTGVRSLWHYCGLHVVDGRSPRRQKGRVADWNPDARTAVLMPGGIADSIVRRRTPRYRDIYDATKARLTETRGIVAQDGAEIEVMLGIESTPGLRPVQIDAIARKVAVKAFLGDLLTEWKRRTAPADELAA